MRAEKVIKALLDASSAVAAIVSTRIYGGVAPEGTAAPVVIFAHLDSQSSGRMSATQSYVIESDIEVLAVTTSYAQLKDLHEAIRVALSFQAGVIAGVTVNTIVWSARGEDQYDSERREFAQSVIYRVSHMEN